MGTAKDESISASSTRQKGNFPMPRSRVDGASQQQQQQHHHSIFLPSTAPVSSLLPSIPAGATHHAMVAPALQALVATPALQALVTPALQAQLAALLTHGAAAAQQQQLHHSLSSASSGSNSLCFAPTAVARPSQLLARTATGSTVANNSSLLSIANNLNMQHWSLDRLGTFTGWLSYYSVQNRESF